MSTKKTAIFFSGYDSTFWILAVLRKAKSRRQIGRLLHRNFCEFATEQSDKCLFQKRKENKRGGKLLLQSFTTDFAEKSEWFDKSLLSKKKWVAQMIPSFFFIYFLCCISILLLNESININRMNLKSSTGCSLSDQHILSPINPKYND